MQIQRSRIAARQADADPRQVRPITHPGFGWDYVLAGRLRLSEREFILCPGQAAEFDTHVSHAFDAADAKPFDYLSLFSPAGEHVHRRVSSGR